MGDDVTKLTPPTAGQPDIKDTTSTIEIPHLPTVHVNTNVLTKSTYDTRIPIGYTQYYPQYSHTFDIYVYINSDIDVDSNFRDLLNTNYISIEQQIPNYSFELADVYQHNFVYKVPKILKSELHEFKITYVDTHDLIIYKTQKKLLPIITNVYNPQQLFNQVSVRILNVQRQSNSDDEKSVFGNVIQQYLTVYYNRVYLTSVESITSFDINSNEYIKTTLSFRYTNYDIVFHY